MSIIEKWGGAFDDTYFYWIAGKTARYLKRAPLWMYPKKRMPAEKHHAAKSEAQTKLFAAPKKKPFKLSRSNRVYDSGTKTGTPTTTTTNASGFPRKNN